MARKATKGERKQIVCMYCDGPIEVSAKAMSIFCPHCHKRVVCEDYTIKSYHAVRNFATCGNVVIESKGHVVAPIRASSLIVRGLVRGDILARKVIEIGSTGEVQGDVESPRLIIHDGAKLSGTYKISRNGTPKKPESSADKPASTVGRSRRMAAIKSVGRATPTGAIA